MKDLVINIMTIKIHRNCRHNKWSCKGTKSVRETKLILTFCIMVKCIISDKYVNNQRVYLDISKLYDISSTLWIRLKNLLNEVFLFLTPSLPIQLLVSPSHLVLLIYSFSFFRGIPQVSVLNPLFFSHNDVRSDNLFTFICLAVMVLFQQWMV